MSYVRCACGEVYNTVGTTTGMSGCCPKCGLHHSGQYRVVKPILKPSPLAAKPIEAVEYMTERIEKIIPVLSGSQAAMAFAEYPELVRCRDCKHMEEDNLGCLDGAFYCDRCGYVKPDGFCKWGERRSE